MGTAYFFLKMSQNPTFYLQFEDNYPVGINTLYVKTPYGGPLETVGDLIAAAVTEPTKSLLGLPSALGQYTLHYPLTGSEGSLTVLEPKFHEGNIEQTPSHSVSTSLKASTPLSQFKTMSVVIGSDYDFPLKIIPTLSSNVFLTLVITGSYSYKTDDALVSYRSLAQSLKYHPNVQEVLEIISD